jgi:hypothetical protein
VNKTHLAAGAGPVVTQGDWGSTRLLHGMGINASRRAVVHSASAELAADEIHERLRQAVVVLFDCYSVAMGQGTTLPKPRLDFAQYMTILEFLSAQGVAGSLSVALSREILVASTPAPELEPGDWAGELVNQMLGRLKTQMLGRGLEMQLSVPTVLKGSQELLRNPRCLRRVSYFESPQGDLCVSLDLAIPSEFVLLPDTGQAADQMFEGETMLF